MSRQERRYAEWETFKKQLQRFLILLPRSRMPANLSIQFLRCSASAHQPLYAPAEDTPYGIRVERQLTAMLNWQYMGDFSIPHVQHQIVAPKAYTQFAAAGNDLVKRAFKKGVERLRYPGVAPKLCRANTSTRYPRLLPLANLLKFLLESTELNFVLLSRSNSAGSKEFQ